MKTKENLKVRSTLFCAFAVLVFVLFFSCEREYITEEKTDEIALGVESSSLKTTYFVEDMLYGPGLFVKGKGKAQAIEALIAGDDFESFSPPYKLYLKNGDDNGGKRCIHAKVKLDGVLVFDPSEITKKVGNLEKEVSLTADSRLEIMLRGKPGNYLEISITGQKVHTWANCYGGTSKDGTNCIIQTTDGGYVVAGSTESNNGDVSGNHGGVDFWVIKLSSSGALEWQRCYGGSDREQAYSIIQTTDGGYVVAGITESNDGDVSDNHGGLDYWVIKLDHEGDIEWQNCYGGSSDDRAYSIIQTTDGGYAVAGHTESNDGDVIGKGGERDFWVIKLTASGDIDWNKCFGIRPYEGANSVIQVTDGGYVVAGNIYEFDDGHGCRVIKLSSSGALEWQRRFGGDSWDMAKSIIQAMDGGYVLVGKVSSDDVSGNHGSYDYWVIKLDSEGDVVWQKCYGGSTVDIAESVINTLDGGYVVAGHTYSNNSGDVGENHGNSDNWVVKLSSNGALEWQRCYGGTSWDMARSIIQAMDGGYVLAGETYSNDVDVSGNHGGCDYWVIKLDQNGNLNVP